MYLKMFFLLEMERNENIFLNICHIKGRINKAMFILIYILLHMLHSRLWNNKLNHSELEVQPLVIRCCIAC